MRKEPNSLMRVKEVYLYIGMVALLDIMKEMSIHLFRFVRGDSYKVFVTDLMTCKTKKNILNRLPNHISILQSVVNCETSKTVAALANCPVFLFFLIPSLT